MVKSRFTPQYEAFRQRLIAWRKAAGLSQRQLAKKLRREHSFVARMEIGDRRVDVVELAWIARACGLEPAKAFAEIAAVIKAADRRKS